jgi:serine/threonine protein kinase
LNLDRIVTELCLLSVEDLFFPMINENETDEKKKEDNRVLKENRKEIFKSLTRKDILRQATEGLVYLHSFNFVHRNLKPSNILIAQDKRNPDKPKYVIKLSDFRTAKNLQDKKEQEHSGYQGSDGWIAPYAKVTKGKIQSDLKEDVFILGCFYYYVLDSQHRHPFGDNVVINSRENEIKKKDHKVYGPDWNHGLPTDKTQPESQAIAIIKDMIQYDPEKRPSIKSILDRAYFLPEDYYKLYDVSHQIPGLCVIFNQYKFDIVS